MSFCWLSRGTRDPCVTANECCCGLVYYSSVCQSNLFANVAALLQNGGPHGANTDTSMKERWNRGSCSSSGRCRGEPGLRKLNFQALYYSWQVYSNHVGYFNKREQRGETEFIVLSSSPPYPFRSQPRLLANLRTGDPSRQLPSAIYIYIATKTILSGRIRVAAAVAENSPLSAGNGNCCSF